jgi:Zn-dependent metalloprotease
MMNTRRVLFGLMSCVLALAPLVSALTPTQAAPPPPEAATLLNTLQAGRATPLRVGHHRYTGMVSFLGGEVAEPVWRAATALAAGTPEQAARAFLAEYGLLFGLHNPSQELSVFRARTDPDGRSSIHFWQVYQGVPVLAGELIVLLDAHNNVLAVTGETLPGLTLSPQPTLTAQDAQGFALAALAKAYGLAPSDLSASGAALWIYQPALLRPGDGPTRLVWRLEVSGRTHLDVRELVLIDAHTGGVALHFNQVDTALNRKTYSANNTTTLPGALKCNEAQPACTSGSDAHADAAHKYAGDTYNFYWSYHARDSIDGAGLILTSTVHYGVAYENAFWNGTQMVYGDAHGYPLGDDVVGHELTHGVTQYESGLFYYYQSGAINESLSDVWGELVDLVNGAGTDTAGVRWLMGEDVAGMGALRNMQNPPAFNDPDKMTSAHYYTGASDSGGVHTNSGVNNKAVYLMVDGGTFNGKTVTALGITKTAKIYYEVQRNLLTSGSDYLDLYYALYQACANLQGTVTARGDCQEVTDATQAVEMHQEPYIGFNPNVTECAAGKIKAATLFSDTLESGSSNWTFGLWWSRTYGFAHGGTYSLYGNDHIGTTGYGGAAKATAMSIPANAYLFFHHAYGFEGPNYDGGVVYYSTNGGANWTPVPNTWMEDYGYDGAIISGTGNPLGGTEAFLDDSHGYVSTRINLATLSGQSNVKFAFFIGVDDVAGDFGWVIDDVSIHTCVTAPYRRYVPLVVK